MRFCKYHALGNDYLVLDARHNRLPSAAERRRLCDRHFGLGSDGVLWGPLPANSPEFERLAEEAGVTDLNGAMAGLRIFNPDGGEAEKSGNGLRIFARFLFDQGMLFDAPVRLLTLGGLVEVQVLAGGQAVRVDMGRVSFQAGDIPVAGETGEVLQRSLHSGGREFIYSAATIGNPHCVVVIDDDSVDLADLVCSYGPGLECHERFPRRTNVQFMRIHDRETIEIAIWERGAGYTLASGSSASACAAVARRLGLVEAAVTVRSPGGELRIMVDENFGVVLEGAVTAVADGEARDEMLAYAYP